MNIDYKKLNKESWNKRTEIHFDSEFYDNKSFVAGRNSLNSIELDILGDVKGKSILHLQCHFGQDTISLTRLGAEAVGVDLSDKAIDRARELATTTKSDATFICCDIYDLPDHLDRKFDIVFTSYGTIGWLPDMDKWASLISRYLKPGGKFVFAEFHPVAFMFDDDFTKIAFDYFNTGPTLESQDGTYTDGDEGMRSEFVEWDHSIGEVMTSLLAQNFRIDSFQEFDYSPYTCFKNTVEIAPGKHRIKSIDKLIPMVYAIGATKMD